MTENECLNILFERMKKTAGSWEIYSGIQVVYNFQVSRGEVVEYFCRPSDVPVPEGAVLISARRSVAVAVSRDAAEDFDGFDVLQRIVMRANWLGYKCSFATCQLPAKQAEESPFGELWRMLVHSRMFYLPELGPSVAFGIAVPETVRCASGAEVPVFEPGRNELRERPLATADGILILRQSDEPRFPVFNVLSQGSAFAAGSTRIVASDRGVTDDRSLDQAKAEGFIEERGMVLYAFQVEQDVSRISVSVNGNPVAEIQSKYLGDGPFRYMMLLVSPKLC